MRFSQRKGITAIRVEIQRDSIDEPLRNKLWSALKLAVFQGEVRGWEGTKSRVWLHFFKEPIDRKPIKAHFESWIRSWFFDAEWYEIYDFIEALYSELDDDSVTKNLQKMVNSFLEAEMSAYRLVAGHITDIASAEEVEAIEAAGRDTEPLGTVRTHLKEALAKLTDRNNPDYRTLLLKWHG